MTLKRVKIIFVSTVLAALCARAFALGADDRLLDFADKLAGKGKYDEALGIYSELLREDPDSDIVNYNAGTVYYLKKDYNAALSSFRKALCTKDFGLERDAFFAMGNTYYRMSEKAEEDDVKEAIELCKKSMRSYKNAIEIDQRDRKVKYNYEVADKRLRALGRKLQKEKDPGIRGGEKLKAGRQKKRDQEEKRRKEEEHRKKRRREKEDREKKDRREEEDQKKKDRREKEDRQREEKRREEDQERQQRRREEDRRDRRDKTKPQDEESRKKRQEERDERRRQEDRDIERKRREEDRRREEQRRSQDQAKQDQRREEDAQQRQEQAPKEEKEGSQKDGPREPQKQDSPRQKGGEPEKTRDKPGEMNELVAKKIIDAYWNGEAPQHIIRQERSPHKKDIEKDW